MLDTQSESTRENETNKATQDEPTTVRSLGNSESAGECSMGDVRQQGSTVATGIRGNESATSRGSDWRSTLVVYQKPEGAQGTKRFIDKD
jgi:hypothetical protein